MEDEDRAEHSDPSGEEGVVSMSGQAEKQKSAERDLGDREQESQKSALRQLTRDARPEKAFGVHARPQKEISELSGESRPNFSLFRSKQGQPFAAEEDRPRHDPHEYPRLNP